MICVGRAREAGTEDHSALAIVIVRLAGVPSVTCSLCSRFWRLRVSEESERSPEAKVQPSVRHAARVVSSGTRTSPYIASGRMGQQLAGYGRLFRTATTARHD